MSHSRTHQARLARQVARATGVGYQQALQQVRTAEAEGLLPMVLNDAGMAEAVRLLTGVTPPPDPAPLPYPPVSSIPAPATVEGFPVLEARPLPDKPLHQPGYVVLCDRGEQYTAGERYVTWIAGTADSGQTWTASHGDYLDTLTEAQASLIARTSEANRAALTSEYRHTQAAAPSQAWTEEDYRLSERVRGDATTHAVLAIEHALTEADRQRILAKFRHGNLNGANVSDILDILHNHDALLNLIEPFYDSGGAAQVSAALGWPAHPEDGLVATRRPTRRALYAATLPHQLIAHAALALALLTDAVPDRAAVTDLVRAASDVAAERWPGGEYLTPIEVDLLGTYRDGAPVIWSAASLVQQVLHLAGLGLVEPVNDGVERTGPVYRMTALGARALAAQEPANR